MSASIMTPYLIAVPGSSIRSPGGLLSKVKTEIPSTSPNRSTRSSFEELTGSSQASKHEERAEDQYHKHVSSLINYGIQVKNLIPVQQASVILSLIAKQITQLPIPFVKNLKLKVTISDHPDVFTANGFFRSEDLLNEQKLQDKLYRLLFEHLLNNFTNLLSLWNEELNEKETFSEQIAKIHQIENTFYAIMQNKKHPKTKSDVAKLRKLLIDYDPSSFSLEWFKSRNRELKKEFQVQFNF